VLDDDLYTADDKLHLQEIATNFQKLFPPHPDVVPEAYLFASKKEFAQRVNSAASKFGFVFPIHLQTSSAAPGPMQKLPRLPSQGGRLPLFLNTRGGEPALLVVGACSA
jgi:hypothetical protein